MIEQIELDDMEVEDLLVQQQQAMALLERLRRLEPVVRPTVRTDPGRRDFRRWPVPASVTVELHDSEAWHEVPLCDMGTGGARVSALPQWVVSAVPARLKAGGAPPVLVLADMVWRDHETAGLHFEFNDDEEQDAWTSALIDALLAGYSLS